VFGVFDGQLRYFPNPHSSVLGIYGQERFIPLATVGVSEVNHF
jgi:hypothetical protein